MVVILHFDQGSLCLQIFHDLFSRLITVHACIFFILIHDLRIVCHHMDHRKIVTQTNLKVIRIVGRRDLYHTSTKFHIHIIIRDQRNFTMYDGKHQLFTHHIFIPVIFWIYRHSSISQQCLRPGGRQIDISAAIGKRIAQMPEMTFLVFVLYLCIRDGRQTVGTPVNDTFSPVNQPFIIQFYKDFPHRLVAALIHGKPFSVPVTG